MPQPPVASTRMRIRRPAADVFEAFVDPAITSNFWFTSGSDRLAPGREVTWEWAMYGFSIPVAVQTVEPNERIVIDWPTANGPTTLEIAFTPMGDDRTFVAVTNSGFSGTDEEVIAQALDATDGFALVLAGLKAWLEHGIALNLVADRHPALARATER